MITLRFVRTVGFLTAALFLLSASLNETLHQLETSPRMSQLAVYRPNGRLQAEYHGNLAQLGAASTQGARPAGFLRRLHLTVQYQWL